LVRSHPKGLVLILRCMLQHFP